MGETASYYAKLLTVSMTTPTWRHERIVSLPSRLLCCCCCWRIYTGCCQERRLAVCCIHAVPFHLDQDLILCEDTVTMVTKCNIHSNNWTDQTCADIHARCFIIILPKAPFLLCHYIQHNAGLVLYISSHYKCYTRKEVNTTNMHWHKTR